jgi:hypothetical protein
LGRHGRPSRDLTENDVGSGLELTALGAGSPGVGDGAGIAEPG